MGYAGVATFNGVPGIPNMLVVIMIESPTGVANGYDIARVPCVDVVIIGNGGGPDFQ